MAASAAQQLLDLLEPRFSFITVANGYTEPLLRIRRAAQEPFVMQDLPSVNYWTARATKEGAQYKHEIWQTDLIIDAYMATRDEAFTDTASRLGDEIMAACQRIAATPALADRVNNYLYNGAAEKVGEIIFTEATYAVGEGGKPYCGVILGGFIRYFVAPGAPSVLLPM